MKGEAANLGLSAISDAAAQVEKYKVNFNGSADGFAKL